jgi:isopenicillin N synthase-like dioxygenase
MTTRLKTCYRIPFFYEPNFSALVKPLRAALSLQENKPAPKGKDEGDKNIYRSVAYGEFLLKKVGNNFDTGRGKYD